ncbi:MAG: PIG-L family deacetylase [Dehalococcoidia bacterium]|nr:PIG-L family deacetylase [Dehalococcoidia bacterium]MCB9485918.1 PIG-L family deacetylase [Thermoflexaceae bacterium]
MPMLLAVMPHPDDEAYAIAGTVAIATAAGWEVAIHCASSGERGKRHDGGPTDPDSVARARESELRRSCEYIGANEPYCWRLPDGLLRDAPTQSPRLQALIRGGAPDVIVTLGPDGAYGHPDHIAVHRWVVDAWNQLPEPRPALLFAAFPHGLFLPQYFKCLAMMGDPPSPPADEIGASRWDLQIDITAVNGRKLAAVSAHRSQLPGGDPYALFPPGVLSGCLDFERFTVAPGSARPTGFPA